MFYTEDITNKNQSQYMNQRTRWESGGTYLEGKCDVPNCENKPNHRHWEQVSYFRGDDELLASLCNEHVEYKQYGTTENIVKEFNARNEDGKMCECGHREAQHVDACEQCFVVECGCDQFEELCQK